MDTGSGSDTIEGKGTTAVGPAAGVEIVRSVLDAGFGADSIAGSAIAARGSASGVEIVLSTMKMGSGGDTITGDAEARRIAYGILNFDFSVFDTGAGDDTITGDANGIRFAFGIFNDSTSTIKTGSGNDAITGTASNAKREAFGIFNDGVIGGGGGNDVFDALKDGWGGGGTVDLGRGDDVLRGFGGGTFIGGSGLDALTFSSGTYRIEGVEGQRGVFQVTLDSLEASPVMNVVGFEFFGEGDQQTRFAAAASAGEVTFV